MAYADGELDEVSRARVERAHRRGSRAARAARAAAEAARDARRPLRPDRRGGGARAACARCWRPMSSDFPAATRPRGRSGRASPRSRRRWCSASRSGATLLVPAGGPVGDRERDDGRAGPAGRARSTPSSPRPSRADAATRIGLSFAAADGRLCRTFDSAAVSGLACRGERGWQLMMTAAGAAAPRGDYRQAGALALPFFHIRAIELAHVVAVEHRRHRLDRLQIICDRIQVVVFSTPAFFALSYALSGIGSQPPKTI